MSRRARSRAAAIEAKHIAMAPLPDDYPDDDDMPDDVCMHCHGDGMDPDCDWLLPCPDCGEVM